MRQSRKYYLKRIGDIFFLQPSDGLKEVEQKMVFLNETAAYLWEKLEECGTEEELIKALIEKYDVRKAIAAHDVSDFIIFLKNNGCLELEDEH